MDGIIYGVQLTNLVPDSQIDGNYLFILLNFDSRK